MDLGAKIYMYCERGQDPAFWAEPLNAVSNAAFLIAALVAAYDYRSQPRESRKPAVALLIGLTSVIGIGSFLFHTYATQWAALADRIPIAVFMVAYFAFVLRQLLGLNWIVVILGLGAFYVSVRYAGGIQCQYGELLPITARAGARCFNGTVGYLPAFLALLGSAAALAFHPAGRAIALASAVFFVSMTFRTLDLELCELSRFGGHLSGSHFVWHILNGLTLYILLRAAVRHGDASPARKEPGVLQV